MRSPAHRAALRRKAGRSQRARQTIERLQEEVDSLTHQNRRMAETMRDTTRLKLPEGTLRLVLHEFAKNVARELARDAIARGLTIPTPVVHAVAEMVVTGSLRRSTLFQVEGDDLEMALDYVDGHLRITAQTGPLSLHRLAESHDGGTFMERRRAEYGERYYSLPDAVTQLPREIGEYTSSGHIYEIFGRTGIKAA